MNKLSANLKKLLLNAKISENELARKTGIAQQVINRILSGQNQNPKISTLIPLSNFFMVSISQLIGDDIFEVKTKINTSHLGWEEIPLLEWDSIIKEPLTHLILHSNTQILIDVKPSNNIFALRMVGNSMEPKFSEGTILIFDPNKKPTNGDFALLKSPSDGLEVRQILIKNKKIYKKCLNPIHANYAALEIMDMVNYIGLLIQSRTDHIAS